MATGTRIYTSFIIPLSDEPDENKGRYWMDVQEDYDTTINKVFPLAPATSALEMRANCMFTKHDGLQFFCHPANILGIEEVTLDER